MTKKIFVITLLLCFLIQFATAQSASESSGGGMFTKRIEYSLLGSGDHNLNGKTEIEKLFFGDFNADLEFLIEPSFEGAYGFRIVGDSLKTSYRIEIKTVNNYDEVTAALNKEYPLKGFPAEKMSSISKEEREQSQQHNLAMIEKHRQESFLRYKVDTLTFPVTDDFAAKLYSTTVAAIKNFKGKGTPPMCFDGFSATFRCIVEDELWTLTVHMPANELLQLTNTFKQLIEDIKTNDVDKLNNYTVLFDDIGSLFEKPSDRM
jgi:hypothetical protein